MLRIGGPQLPDSLALVGDFCDTRHARYHALLRAIALPLITLMMAGLVLLVAFNWVLGLILLVAALPGTLVRLRYAQKRFDLQQSQTDESQRDP